MRTLCVLLAAALLFVPVTGTAGDHHAPKGCEPRGLAGTQAVQFSVGGHLSLGAFQGQLFSYQRFLTDSRAIRVAGGLELDLDYVDQDIEVQGGEQTGSAETSGWNHEVMLKVQMQFYRGDGPLRFFWGAGPKVVYSDSHYEDVNFNTYDDDLEYRFRVLDSDKWDVGVQGFAGVEWFINDTFSLHGEYSVSGMYSFRDGLERQTYSDSPDYDVVLATSTRSPRFTSDGARIGLSARF